MDRTIDPLVSTEWLEARTHDSGLVVVDIREPHLYAAGHIPGSISIPFSPVSEWATSSDELLLELPPVEDLFASLSGHGIAQDSQVLLVGTVEPPPAPPYALSDAPRVAATLFYAGTPDVAILDGGYPKWVRESRPVTTEVPAVVPSVYSAAVAPDMFVSTDYVRARINQVVLLDGRDPDQFFGVNPCPFAGVGGHIPTARSFPVPWIWLEDGIYRPAEVLRSMAEGIVGANRGQEIVTYCGVGGYAAALWFVLTQILDYTNVKIYDGAAEAWVKSDSMISYTW